MIHVTLLGKSTVQKTIPPLKVVVDERSQSLFDPSQELVKLVYLGEVPFFFLVGRVFQHMSDTKPQIYVFSYV